ncbi:MAG: methionine--tRNA ligase [Acidobacteria bacterium]|nr:methionine--tRNA ligase [Acidobacteriota bacterium]
MKKYYITTPIYYVNATPHIGHAYTTLASDSVKRFRRMLGEDAVLTTGTDEHGQKVEQSAQKAGWTPQEFTDSVSAAFRREWDELGVDYDHFRRTTDPLHAQAVHEIFLRCKEAGYIYKASYSGKYSVTDEMFITDEEAAALDPDKVIEVTEENYFFKLSAFGDKLLELYRSQPDFVQPEARRNEVIAFVEQGLKDLSISRSSLKWGIPLPDDPAHVFYVWFDALTTYMSAIGYGETGERRQLWEKLWPADVHMIGKEIVRFHAVYWPAFLMAAGLPLPKKIYAHGWLVFQGDKMSKSKGNIVRARPIAKVVGVEGLRYYLLREIVFGQDGNFSWEALVERYNSDLANGLGNLFSRTLTMLNKYRDGVAPEPPAGDDSGLPEKGSATIAAVTAHFEKFEFSRGLEALWSLLSAVDKYIVTQQPWKLANAQDADSQARLSATLYNAAEALRLAAVLAYPILPDSTPKIWKALGQSDDLATYPLRELAWGGLAAGGRTLEPEPLYPRLDVEKSVKEMQALEEEALKEQAATMGKPAEESKPALVVDTPEIQIDDFFKVDMRVGLVLEARQHPNADKLLHLTIDIGEAQPRSICAGVAGVYDPAKLVGRKVAIVANLKPRKMRGIESQGMIIAASGDDHHPYLVSFLEDAPIGARLG